MRHPTRRGLLAAAALAAGPAAARPLDEARSSGWLRIALYEDYAPFSWLEEGRPRGIDAEIGARIAVGLGLAPRWLTRAAADSVDDDLRLNIWRGDLVGSGVADVMMHVPVDRELARRNDLVAILGGYLRHQLALAYDEAATGHEPGFEVFERLPIGVETDTNSDFFLLQTQGGKVRANVRHYLPFEAAIAALREGQVAAVMGQRGQIEGQLRAPGDARFKLMVPRLPAVFGREWTVGVAVRQDSRDLGYAVGDILDAMRESGEIAAICARHGVTWLPPG